jgi:type II secretory ATPase GspE/PulE/Tfp pilus assembly ATPase PilB-like protein
VRSGGMESLRAVGLRAVYDGLTTVEEILRETFHSV